MAGYKRWGPVKPRGGFGYFPSSPGTEAIVMDAGDIAIVAKQAGFKNLDLVAAVAIALAESSGDSNDTTGDEGTSWGLWQIHWTVHPEFDKSQLLDPHYNAYAAFKLYTDAGNTFQPWSTYKTGAFLAFMKIAWVGVRSSFAASLEKG